MIRQQVQSGSNLKEDVDDFALIKTNRLMCDLVSLKKFRWKWSYLFFFLGLTNWVHDTQKLFVNLESLDVIKFYYKNSQYFFVIYFILFIVSIFSFNFLAVIEVLFFRNYAIRSILKSNAKELNVSYKELKNIFKEKLVNEG